MESDKAESQDGSTLLQSSRASDRSLASRVARRMTFRGNTSRKALFPSVFTLVAYQVFGLASLNNRFAAAPKFRPATGSAVIADSFLSSRTSSLTCFVIVG